MRAYARGEHSALEELFQRHARALRGFIRRDVRDRDEADDLLQQTFLQLHRARRDFRGEGNVRGWLFTIARNLKIDLYRRRSRRPTPGPLVDEAASADPTRAAARRQAAREGLQRALEALPPNQREVVRMHWMDQVPYAEIALRLGATESAVKVRAHRAYRTLKRVLDQREGAIGVER